MIIIIVKLITYYIQQIFVNLLAFNVATFNSGLDPFITSYTSMHYSDQGHVRCMGQK